MSIEVMEQETQPQDLLTIEAFNEMWGEKSGFNPEQIDDFWLEAQEGYTDELPYHNWLHAREVLWATMRLADQCEDNGIELDRRVLISAALFHDFNYHLDHIELGYEAKEEWSADLYIEHMPKFGLNDETIGLGAGAIIATTAGAPVKNIYDIILVRADLENIAGDYFEDYLRKGRLFHTELEQQSHKDIPILKFVAGSMEKLSMYLSNDLTLPFENPKDRQKVFKVKAIENIKRDVRETVHKEGLKIVQFLTAQKFGGHVFKVLGYRKPTDKAA